MASEYFIDIRDYIDRFEMICEIPSEYTFQCPCCGGKFKVSKAKGLGLCVTGLCNIKDILQEVNIGLNYKQVEKISGDYVPFPNHFELVEDPKYISTTKSKRYFSEKYKEPVEEVTYYYDDNHKLYRLNLLISKDKVPIPNYKDKYGNWQIGVVQTFPFYNENRLIKTLKKYVIVVEGEKTADIFSTLSHYVAITPPCGFGWSYNWLKDNLPRLIDKVAGFIVIPDNDEIGRKKAYSFQNIAWANYFPCQIVDFDFLYKSKGDDLVDLHEYGYDLRKIVKHFILSKR